MKIVIPSPGRLRFETWFDKMGLKNFTGAEIAEYFNRTRRGVRNAEPPRYLWQNSCEVFHLAQAIRTHFGAPCIVYSSYRSPDYNRAVGGVKSSFHMKFNALDIALIGVDPADVAKQAFRMRRAGLFKGGIGTYPSFTHIDTRGYNANW